MIPTNLKRIIVYLGTEKNEELSRIRELTGQSESTISKILSKRFSLKQVDEMVILRKKYTPLHVIAKEFKTSHSKVREILKNRLNDDYDKYHANGLKLTSRQKNKIVRLGKKRLSLDDIALKFKISIAPVKRILKEELGDDYDKYRSSGISEVMRILIVHLHREGKSMEDIADKKVSFAKVFIFYLSKYNLAVVLILLEI